jgi:hypothetical protein
VGTHGVGLSISSPKRAVAHRQGCAQTCGLYTACVDALRCN